MEPQRQGAWSCQAAYAKFLLNFRFAFQAIKDKFSPGRVKPIYFLQRLFGKGEMPCASKGHISEAQSSLGNFPGWCQIFFLGLPLFLSDAGPNLAGLLSPLLSSCKTQSPWELRLWGAHMDAGSNGPRCLHFCSNPCYFKF